MHIYVRQFQVILLFSTKTSLRPREITLQCKVNQEKGVAFARRAGMLLFRVDGANRCSSDKELIALIINL